MRELLAFGRPLFGVTLSAQLQAQSDELLIGILGSAAAVTPYALARRIAEVPRAGATAFGRVVLPVAAGAADDVSRTREVLVATTRVTVAIVASTTAPLLPLAGPFLVAWAGSAYTDDVAVSWLLLVATAIELAVWPAGSVLQAIARHGVLARQALICAAINVALSIALFRPFGVAGIASATLVASTVGTAIVLGSALREVEMPAGRLVRHGLVPPLLPALPAALVSWLLVRWLDPTTIMVVGGIAIAGGSTYLGLYLALPQATLERDLVRSLGRRLARR